MTEFEHLLALRVPCLVKSADSKSRAVDSEPQHKPYRDRAEMYALKDGKVFGSLYPGGGFGVYGGGIDPGEDQLEAAVREFQEECGYTVKNPVLLPFKPHLFDWKPPYSTDKQRKRAKQYRGSRTYYVSGELGEKIPDAKTDEKGRTAKRLYALDEAMKLCDCEGDEEPDIIDGNSKRIEVLEHLKKHGGAETFEQRNEKAKVEALKSRLPHVRDGYVHCKCGKQYYAIPDGHKCPACGGHVMLARSVKRGSYIPTLVLVKRADDDDSPFTIAVDLDGTLAEKEEPFSAKSIGEPRADEIDWVKKFHKAGARIIIHTVRGDKKQLKAWLDKHDVPYDFIGENPDQPAGSSNKLFADVYFDDKAKNPEDIAIWGPDLLAMLQEHS